MANDLRLVINFDAEGGQKVNGVLNLTQANLKQLTRELKAQGTAADDTFTRTRNGIDSLSSKLASARNLLIGGGIAAFVKSGIDAADALNDMADRTGIAVEKLSGFQLATKLADTSMESFQAAANKLSINIAKNSEEFAKLGITAKDPADAFIQLAGVFARIEDPQQRAALGAAALGKSWAEMAPLLAQGSEALRQQVDEGQRMSGVTSENVKLAAEFNDKLDALSNRSLGFRTNFALGVLEPLAALAESIDTDIRKFGVLEGVMRGIADGYQNFSLKDTGGGLSPELDSINRKLAEKKQLLKDAQTGNTFIGEGREVGLNREINTLLNERSALEQKISDQRRSAVHTTASNAEAEAFDKSLQALILKSSAEEDAAKKAEIHRQSLADTKAKAYANEREEVAKTLANIQQETDLIGLSSKERSRAIEMTNALAKAKGDEITQITSALETKWQELDIQEKLNASYDETIRRSQSITELANATNEAERLAAMVDALRLQGLTNDQIRERIALEKELHGILGDNQNFNQADVEGLLARRQAAEKKLSEFTDASSKKSAEVMDTAFKRAIENIQDGLADMFKSVLSGDATNSFRDFANSIKTMLVNTLSQAMSTGLMNALAGKASTGDYVGLITGGAMVAGQLIGNALSKSTPTRTLSPAEQNTVAGVGTGAMKIADMFGRDTGYAYQSQAVTEFNRNAQQLGSLISTALTNMPGLVSIGQSIAGAIKEAISPAITAIQNLAGTAATQVADSASSALSGAAGKIAAVLAVVSAGFEIASIAGNKALTDAQKAAQSLYSLSGAVLALAGTVVLAPIAIMAAAVIHVIGSVVDMVASGINANNLSHFMGGHLGGLLADWFMPPDPPTIKMTSRAARVNAGNEPWSKSNAAGINTAFGQVAFQASNVDISAKDMNKAFGQLLKTVQSVDSGLAATLNTLDAAAGQAGKSMNYFNQRLADGARKSTTQELENMNTGAMLKTRYAWITDMLAASGSLAGQAVDAWFDVITDKFIKKSKKNATQVLGIVSMLTASLEEFMKLPLSLTGVIADSVKSVKQGGTPTDVADEIMGIVASFSAAKIGLKALGTDINDERVVTFLAGINKIGAGVVDAGANLVAYANAQKRINKGVALSIDQLMTTVESKFKALQAQKFDNSQISAFFSSFGLFSKLYSEAGVAFKEADLDTVAASINDLSKASQQTAKNVIDQTIANEKLGKKARDVAINTLVAAGKLDAATVAEAEYGISVQKTTKDLLSSMGFVQQLGFIAGKSLGQMSVSVATWLAAARNVDKVFGSMEEAMKTFDSIAASFLSSQEYAQYNLDTANRAIANMQATYPQLLGITSASITAMLKSGSGMKQFIEDMANGDGSMAKTTVEYIQLLMQQKDAQLAVNDSTQAMIDSMQLMAEDQFKTAVDYKRYLSLAALSGVQSAADSLGWNTFVPAAQVAVVPTVTPVSTPTSTPSTSQNDAVLAELKQIRLEQQAQAVAVAQNTQDTANILKRWNGDGMPATRVI